jgi:hypothetical protein
LQTYIESRALLAFLSHALQPIMQRGKDFRLADAHRRHGLVQFAIVATA